VIILHGFKYNLSLIDIPRIYQLNINIIKVINISCYQRHAMKRCRRVISEF
jgi:hypothetical protein